MISASTSIVERIAASVERKDALSAADGRADGRRRSVRLSRERVTIERCYRGIAMRLTVPVSAYLGVSVGVRAADGGGFLCELRLAHRDPELSVLLDEDRDEARIWAAWRAAAGFFGVPALVEREGGPEPWGAVGAPASCRGRRPKRRARPGIVARRNARPGAMGTVHREDEIIARD